MTDEETHTLKLALAEEFLSQMHDATSVIGAETVWGAIKAYQEFMAYCRTISPAFDEKFKTLEALAEPLTRDILVAMMEGVTIRQAQGNPFVPAIVDASEQEEEKTPNQGGKCLNKSN